MKKILTFITLILFLNHVLSAQAVWTGGGDASSWDDGANWETGVVPLTGETVEIGADVTITGTATAIPSQVKAIGSSTVVLDLDLTIGDAVTEEHALTVSSNSTLILGAAGTNRVFVINPESTRQGVAIFGSIENGSVTVSESTSVTFVQGNNGINVTSIDSNFTNDGIVSFSAAVKNAFKILGTATNNGTINIGAVTGDGVGVGEGGDFVNNGTISADQPFNDVVEIEGGTFTNNGSIDGTIKDDAGSGNNVIAVGTAELAGTFINSATGTVTANAGIAENGRAISVNEMGTFTNEGTISVTGGNEGSRFYSRGNSINAFNAIFDLTDGRMNINNGSFTNNGLIKTTREGSGIFSAEEATLVNNAFIDYASSNNFATGTGTITDNGRSINANALNYNGQCGDTIALETYEYFYNDNGIGTTDENGVLDVTGADFMNADSVQITTSIPGVAFYIKNYCDEAIFVDMTDNVNNILTMPLTIYPTLTTRGALISLDLTAINTKTATLFISDLSGKTVLMKSLTSGTFNRINSSDLPMGMLLLRVFTEDSILSGKIVIN